MNKHLAKLTIGLTLSLSPLFAATDYHLASEALDSFNFAAPAVPGQSSIADQQTGMIIYNLGNHAFEGLSDSGTWISLGIAGSNQVTSGGTERVERATITNNGTVCTISAQSGSWVSGASRVGTGICAASIGSGIFSAAPVCVCSGASGVTSCNTSGTNSTTLQTVTRDVTTAGGPFVDNNINVICMGPR